VYRTYSPLGEVAEHDILAKHDWIPNMTSTELRTKFLEFFESKGHLIYPSDSLVPDDPSLLYTSAGMVQFKPYFVGDRVPPAPRIVTSQKCMRTDDIDEVGDAVHHTFFEMLGNFSFGDYFKRESIIWAWEFLTEVLGISPDNLWTSIYLDDDEAYDVWANEIKFPPERIVRLGADKNYWPANAPTRGPNGPCGPCNEIFLDVTPEKGVPEDAAWAIAHDVNRFVEIWNLVFQQFDRQEDGTLKPLPTKNIDTGMGLERTIAVLNGTPTNYETDLFLPILRGIEEASGVKYGTNEETDRAFRVIADHIRSAVFAIADGVMPSNVGRGYVLRRLIRNAVVKGRKLGLTESFLSTLAPIVVEIMGGVYPEISEVQHWVEVIRGKMETTYVEMAIETEEKGFHRTLESGLQRLEDQIRQAASSSEKILDGRAAFMLYDTYGFPLEITREIASESGISVDIDGFEAAMEEQRRRGKEGSVFGAVMVASGDSVMRTLEDLFDATTFVGYEVTESCANVYAIIVDGHVVPQAEEGDRVEIVLDSSPFYAESGGQVGDTGTISAPRGLVEITNTRKDSRFHFHAGIVKSGLIFEGDTVQAVVDKKRRMAIARNHTATHLLHAALHEVLGEHALQKGSVVEPGRLRFDFSHFQAVTPEEMRRIEDHVNELVLADVQANTVVTNIDEARQMGATALFGEKYGSEVRVVKMGDVSVELCGGTHLCHTSQVGLFKLVSESSIGAGIRRIEAVTGEAAVRMVHEAEDQLRAVADALGSAPTETVASAQRTVNALREAQREIGQMKARGASEKAGDLAESAREANGVKYVTATLPTVDVPTLRKLADVTTDKLKSGMVVLAGVSDGKVLFVSKVTPDLVGRGFHAGNTLREVAKIAGGGGGGRPEFAQAGGKDASKVDEALAKAVEIIEAQAG